jgi:DNA repair exonuclease SbcCD ATPase subunit
LIIFEKVKWKNFLSTGDRWIEIELNTEASTLIVGANGSGKSTLLDALSFGLFGKPHRDIKKPQLMNSINQKECVVEVEFKIGSTSYKIVRGMKPNVFEIWQNGALMNQDSHNRDYQKILEQNILKLNHKSFHQIVMLGSSSFIPFMQLPTGTRREVIEDLLDINIFTKMNILLKEKTAKLRDNLGAANYESDLVSEKIRLQHNYIEDLKSMDAEQQTKKQDKIIELETKVNKLITENEKLSTEYETFYANLQAEWSEANEKKQKLLTWQGQIKNNISTVVKEARFYEDNSECPTCAQPIADDFKQKRTHVCRSRAKELSDGQDVLIRNLQAVGTVLQSLSVKIAEGSKLNNQVLANNTTIRNFQSQIRDLEKEAATKSNIDIADAEKTLAEYNTKMEGLGTLKNSYYESGAYNQAISEMLKDTGIKTKVIRQYLPIMNKLVNQYLQTLDFYVSFNLNESFEEVIRSRHRDEFSYASFSEGEKMKIDLSLLFTWRQVARTKNSVSTNLLILDEVMDGSLDDDGLENLQKIINFTTDSENTSIFIISHKKELSDSDKFKNKITFEKTGNFSVKK